MRLLIPVFCLMAAEPELGAGAPIDAVAAADGPPPDEKSKLEQIRDRASLNQPVANERAERLAASGELKLAALAAAKEQVGIKNALEVVAFGVALAKAIEEAKKDGKLGLEDIGQLFPVAPLVVPMIEGIGEVPKELGDLDEVELEALMLEAGKILGGGVPAQTVKKVRAALKFAHAGYDLYMAFAEK